MLTDIQKLEIEAIKQRAIADGLDSISVKHKVRNRRNLLKRKNKKKYGDESIVRGNNSSIHHIFPQSKYKGYTNNTIRINNRLHAKYHILFDNKDPYEILDYLVNYFWDGNSEILKKYLESICLK